MGIQTLFSETKDFLNSEKDEISISEFLKKGLFLNPQPAAFTVAIQGSAKSARALSSAALPLSYEGIIHICHLFKLYFYLKKFKYFYMKGQAAVEYMIIIGIAMAILVPLFVILNSYTYETRSDLKIRALEDSMDSIAESSNMVYFQGYPAKMSVNLYVPEGVVMTNVSDNLFRVRVRYGNGYTDIVSMTDAIVNGSLPTKAGIYKITIKAVEDGWVNVSY